MKLLNIAVKGFAILYRGLTFLAPIADLMIRAWIFKVFFFSGMLKLKSWQSTLALFENEYSVPLLSPEIAAILGTSAEIILPSLLLIGLLGRLSACALFVFNLVILASYPFLWTPDGMNGLYQHITWGIMIMVPMVYGPGKLSLDYILNRFYPSYEY